MLTDTAYAPFDGVAASGGIVPYFPAKPLLSGSTNTLYTPVMSPGNAFFFARCAKNFYLALDAVNGDLNSTSVISTRNIIKRFTVEGNTPGRVVFKAQGNKLVVSDLIIDFSQGWYGHTTDLYSNEVEGYVPRTTFNMASTIGAATIAADGSVGALQFQGMPAIGSNSFWYGIGIQITGSGSLQISNPNIINSYIQLTERYDQLAMSTSTASVGSLVTVSCPAQTTALDSTAYRSGFADVKSIYISGVTAPLTLGSAATSTTFLLSASRTALDAVKDQVSFIVPAGAATGPIKFVSITDTQNPLTTTDYYQTCQPLYIV